MIYNSDRRAATADVGWFRFRQGGAGEDTGWLQTRYTSSRTEIPTIVDTATEDMRAMATSSPLVDEYRVRCLWFLRSDYYPTTTDERLRVLDSIERHGDVEAFRRVARMRRWLSPDSSGKSAGF